MAGNGGQPQIVPKLEFYGEDMLPEDQKELARQEDYDEGQASAPADFGNGPREQDAGSRAFEPDDGQVPRAKPSRGRPPVLTDDPSKVVPVKGIPKRMLSIAKRAFPGDATQTDAFVAYLVCNCPEFAADRDLRKLGLTDRQKALVQASETSEYNSMMKKLNALAGKMDRANSRMATMTGMLMLLLYEYTGNDSSNEQITAGRIAEKDLMGFDNGRFVEFREAVLNAFKRFVLSTSESDAYFFN